MGAGLVEMGGNALLATAILCNATLRSKSGLLLAAVACEWMPALHCRHCWDGIPGCDAVVGLVTFAKGLDYARLALSQGAVLPFNASTSCFTGWASMGMRMSIGQTCFNFIYAPFVAFVGSGFLTVGLAQDILFFLRLPFLYNRLDKVDRGAERGRRKETKAKLDGIRGGLGGGRGCGYDWDAAEHVREREGQLPHALHRPLRDRLRLQPRPLTHSLLCWPLGRVGVGRGRMPWWAWRGSSSRPPSSSPSASAWPP